MSMMSNVELNGKSIVGRKVHKDRLSRGSEIEPSKEYRGIASSMVDLFFDVGQEIEGLLMEFWQASYADIAWRGSGHSKRYVFVLFEGTQSAEKAVQGQQEIMQEGRRIRVRQTGSNEFLCVNNRSPIQVEQRCSILSHCTLTPDVNLLPTQMYASCRHGATHGDQTGRLVGMRNESNLVYHRAFTDRSDISLHPTESKTMLEDDAVMEKTASLH